MTGIAPDAKASRLSVLVDGRVMRDSYHGIGRYRSEEHTSELQSQ